MADLIKRGPFRSLFAWPSWMDEDVFPTLSGQRGLKIHDDEKNIYVEAVVAGVPNENVDIEIDDGVLMIKAEEKQEEKVRGMYKSSSYQYYYTCALSGGQWDKADAEIKHGVVHLTIPKTEAARPRKITVKAK